MNKAGVTTAAQLPKTFTDVIYLTTCHHMPDKIAQLLSQKKLSFSMLPSDESAQLFDQLDLIGTVVIDATGLDNSQRQQLAQITELLRTKNVASILVEDVDSLLSMDQLADEIDDCLAGRENSPQVTANQSSSPIQAQQTYRNWLTDQLTMTEALVDSLSEQLRMAGLVQRDFLPTKLPNTDKIQWATVFLPAEQVSGDIYDIVRVDEQHIGFYVADVVGHGVPAALLTIFIKQALVMRRTIDHGHLVFPPAEVMNNLNIRMADQKLSGHQFATCCYCLLNTKTLQLTYARGGHPYPVLIRPNEQPQLLQVRGALLGIFKETEYIQETIQMRPGDKLLLYSDGADLCFGNFDESAGFKFSEQFYDIQDLPIIEITEKLNSIMQSHRTQTSELDDITIVGLEIF